MEPALLELFAEGTPDDEVAVIVRLSDPVALPDGVRVVAQFGPIVTCRLLRGDIPRIRAAPPVRSMKAARLYGPARDDESEAPSRCACHSQSSEDAPTQQPGDVRRLGDDLPTGKGIVIAHIDWGMDFAHPDFREADGRTRLLSLWDQSSPPDPARPNRYGYGRIYDASDIDRVLAEPDPYGALGYSPAKSDPGTGCHGTHTLGISAGNGRAGSPVGLAPDAKLIFVHLSTYTADGPTLLGDSVALLEAFDFIARVAGDAPVVINASLGRHAGEHTGTTLTEQGMDAFLRAAPGRAIVQSTGNYFDRQIHARGTLRPGEIESLRVITDVADRTPNEVDLWYPGVDRFVVTVDGPGGVAATRIAPGEQAQIVIGERVVGRAYHRIRDPNNGDNQFTLILYKDAPPGEWTLDLFGQDVADGRFHAWIERDAACGGCQARFAPEDSDPTSTIGTICNGLRTIAVGAYDAHRDERPLAKFSSCGPTRDGRQKPDLVAPGVRVLAARCGPHGDGRPLVTRMSGTSMAAPHVTGTIALMFEAAGRPLFIEETRRLLLSSTVPVHASATSIERARIGSGYLDTAAAVNAARRSTRALAAPVKRVAMQGASVAAFDSEDVMTSESNDDIPRDAYELETAVAIDESVAEDEPAFVATESNEHLDTVEGAYEPETFAERRGRWRKESPALPFQFQIPIGGGAPALSVPLGGAGSPFAFAVPLGATPATPVAVPAMAVPVAAPPAGAAPQEPSLKVAAPDEPLYEPLEHIGFDAPHGHAPSATSLFNVFSRHDHPLHRHYAMRFEPLARPGEPLSSIVPRPGDVFVRVAPGEDWGRIGVVASPGVHPHDRLSETGLRGEGDPQPLPGGYVHVAEPGPGRHASKDRFARRICDAARIVLPDSLLLRPLGGQRETLQLESRYDDSTPTAAATAGGTGEPSAPLRSGSQGEAVRTAQRQLNKIHNEAVALGLPGLDGCPLAEDGRFDRRMEQAVTAFQQQVFSDPEKWNGVIDADTQKQLEMRASSPSATPGAPSSRENVLAEMLESASRPTIRRGSQGPSVREAQARLNAIHLRELAAGRAGLPACPLAEDGIFGDNTFKAVVGFQRLAFPAAPGEWDGVVGAKTWAALDQFAVDPLPVPPVPPPVPPPSPDQPAFPPAAVIDERIDPDAQFSLQRLSRGTPDAREDAVGMLGAVKGGQLAGIFGDNLKKAAELAARHGTQRWLLIPKGEDGALILEPGDFTGALPPTILFRGGDPPKGHHGIRKEPQRLDAALRKAWATFLLLKSGQVGPCERPPGDEPVVALRDAEAAQPRVIGNLVPLLCQLQGKPPPPPAKPKRCALPSKGKEDPSALVESPLGTIEYDGGTMTTSGRRPRTLKVRGTVFYPATADGSAQDFNAKLAERAPIVFLAHGNHPTLRDPGPPVREFFAGDSGIPANATTIPNHKGYEYFQEQLGRMGIIAVSVDCNELNERGFSARNIKNRAELVAASIKHFQSLDTGGDKVFGNHIDFARVGLMGHSRGGEAMLLVPELTGSRAPAGATIKAVLALAPTDTSASSGTPRGFAFMTILPAGDGDVFPGFGAKFYDKAVPSPFKSQLDVHEANHNFFNREWVHIPDAKSGAGPMAAADHEHVLSVYGCALFRTVLLGHALEKIVTGREVPLGAPTDKVHIAAELAAATTVEDHDDANAAQNSQGQTIVKFGYATADEKPFSQAATAFNRSFFGNTVGLVLERNKVKNQYTSPLAKTTNLTGREVWIRCGEIYTGSIPANATGFKIAVVDASNTTVFIDSDEAGGLPRPFDRRADDIAHFGVDHTKTMPKTLRFPASCFTQNPKLDIKKIKAVLLHLDRGDNRALAFDQLQIV